MLLIPHLLNSFKRIKNIKSVFNSSNNRYLISLRKYSPTIRLGCGSCLMEKYAVLVYIPCK
jgi:hypothetical protein